MQILYIMDQSEDEAIVRCQLEHPESPPPWDDED